MRRFALIILSSALTALAVSKTAAPQGGFVPDQYDPLVGDWLPRNPGDCVAQVFATGRNAYQTNVLAAFDDESSGEPIAILRGTRPDGQSPVALRGGAWTGTLQPDCCGNPQLEIVHSKTGEKMQLAQYMRPNPRLRVPPPEGAVLLFTERMRDGVMTLEAGPGRLASHGNFGAARAHLEFRILSGKSAGAVTLWKRAWIGLFPSYGRGGVKASGSLESLAPRARAERAVLEWQALDIETNAGRVTVFLNGVKIHDSVAGLAKPAARFPLEIEARGEPLEFRNVWVQPE